MANRLIARKIKLDEGVVFLVADDYAKTFIEYDVEPSLDEFWADVFDEVSFEDLASEVDFDVNSGLPLLNDNGVPISERVFILEE